MIGGYRFSYRDYTNRNGSLLLGAKEWELVSISTKFKNQER